MTGRIEDTILVNLVNDVEYMRKCIPFLQPEYFHTAHDKIIFETIKDFVEKYNNVPSKEVLLVSLAEHKTPDHSDILSAVELVKNLDDTYRNDNLQWAVDITEKFCQDKALFNAVLEALSIMEGNHKELVKDAIPDVLSKALAVSFDHNIGHNYLENAKDRYDFYTADETRLPFDIDILNKITRGGLPNKTLMILLGGTGTGKTNIQCHFSADYLRQGKNVLYITMEMAEERIAERIDANLLNVDIAELGKLGKDAYMGRISKLAAKTRGTLIIKEYPPVSAHAGHFKALIDELKLKKNFTPDVIVVDYLGICASSRYKPGANVNSYTMGKAVAEELRGLAVYYNVPLITSMQTNRQGSTNSDLGMEDSSDSFGPAMTADVFIALHSNDELAALNQLMMKVLKNRYNSLDYYGKFMVGVDRKKMRIYDLESSAQLDTQSNDMPELPPYISNATEYDFSGFSFND